MYEKQYVWVRWGEVRSGTFLIVNGTRQGSVLSPALFAVYMDEIFRELRNLGVGCYIGDIFIRTRGYADDLLLLAPSRTAIKMMCWLISSLIFIENIDFQSVFMVFVSY